jgi:glycosyltransferase involved in cell wall biosynthesis
MSKISIIIPAYNASQTLAACLGNLVHQTLTDIEIILVNDCSTDNTLQIMMDCESQFSDKIIVVNSDKNRGAGGARNVGLCYASGDYIGFVDSDDIVTTDMYEKLYQKALEGDYDIVDCGYYSEASDDALVHTSDDLTGILNDYKRSELIASGGYLWSKIFRKSFLDSQKLTFRENCILEDCETLMLLFSTARNIGNVKEILYCYKKSQSSISNCVNTASYFQNAAAAIEAIHATLSTLPNYSGIQAAVEYSIANLCALSANACLIHGASDPEFVQRERFQRLSRYMNAFVKIPISSNKYICNKISPQDQQTLNDLIRFR